MDQAIRQLHEGKVLTLVAEIRNLAKQLDDDKSQTKVDNVATYFKERADAVDYDKFREKGWPLSSGKVEGGHIHFVHPITKRGSGWLVPNLNNTLALMCIRESNWWQEFWESAGCRSKGPAKGGGRMAEAPQRPTARHEQLARQGHPSLDEQQSRQGARRRSHSGRRPQGRAGHQDVPHGLQRTAAC